MSKHTFSASLHMPKTSIVDWTITLMKNFTRTSSTLLPTTFPSESAAVLNLLLSAALLRLLLRSLVLTQLLWDPGDGGFHQHLLEIVPNEHISGRARYLEAMEHTSHRHLHCQGM